MGGNIVATRGLVLELLHFDPLRASNLKLTSVCSVLIPPGDFL